MVLQKLNQTKYFYNYIRKSISSKKKTRKRKRKGRITTTSMSDEDIIDNGHIEQIRATSCFNVH